MYCGIKLNVSVNNYDTALKALEERCKRSRGHKHDFYPGGGEVPLGHRRSEVTKVRMKRDESIAFKLYRTDVVTWHPDNSVTVEAYPTVTTGAFANALLPTGLNLGGESQLMTFFPAVPDDSDDWRARWACAEVCHGDGTYRQVDGTWLPDTDTLTTLTKVVTDRAEARRVSREYPFAKLKLWLFAACDVMDIEYKGTDYPTCADELLAGNFRKAAECLPPVTVPNGFGIRERLKPLRIRGTRYDEPITLSSVDYLRRWVYDDEGVYAKEQVPTMPRATYESQRTLQSQLARAGVHI